MLDVRPSPIAGTWYPGDREALKESIDHLLQASQPKPFTGHALGLVVPHAGHRYSGGVAAHAYRCVENLEPQVVAVVSPLHSFYPGHVLTTTHAAYATPLGEIPIAHAQLDRLYVQLKEHSGLELERIRKDSEHAIEIELPFLQRVLHDGFQLLPIMIRDQSPATARSLGHALSSVLREEDSLLVASTDLSHGYPQETARKFDREMLARIEALDPDAVLEAESSGVGFACGRAAVAAVLWAAKELGADRVQLLDYATSGDVTGDYQGVVGYGAAVILRADDE